MDSSVLEPSPAQVQHYLDLWDSQNYHLQEDDLTGCSSSLAPEMKTLRIFFEASTLNDFYSTNIFNFSGGKTHPSLRIDGRLKDGDASPVGDIQHRPSMARKRISFVCHKILQPSQSAEYPIYDSYVDRAPILQRPDGFAEFKTRTEGLRPFQELLIQFREFYRLQG